MNHQVTDLRGTLDFLELWATIARGEPINYSRIPKDWTHTPSRFFAGLISDSTKPTAPPPFTVTATPDTGPAACFIAPSAVSTWKFSKNSLEQLKLDFSPKDSESWISSGDALSALITGVITRARTAVNVPRLDGRSSLESQVERVAMAADGRYRAPEETMANGQYFGNFNNLWSADISRADLLSPTSEAGSSVAVAIRNGLKDALSAESIANRIAFFEAPESNEPPSRIIWGADVILTNWCRFDLQGPSFDLGWGRPFHATPGTGGALPPAYSLMTRVGDTGDISVLMTVEADAGDALKADALLNKYATFQA
ncbi:hypothetical protein BJV82DRAFT_595003 [Fennellomyces sp. T-0311]|nr:hypothetical protein BJV82DRAFT_595003 [Fennellomyces sp. T-0311]